MWCLFRPRRKRDAEDTSVMRIFVCCHISSNLKQIKPSMRWVGHTGRMGGMQNAYTISVEKLEGKRRLVRTRQRQKKSIKLNLRKKNIM
jgi:ribosomal protein L21E